MAEIKKISTELQLLNKFLDTSGSAGSSGSVLTSTATGTSWVSTGTPGSGVYLPLAGGTMTGVTQFNDHTQHGDQVQARWGVGNDLILKHNATDSFIENYTGHLNIANYADDKDILFWGDDGSGGITTYLTLDGSEQSIVVTASLGMFFNDGVAARFGDVGDLLIYHDASNSYIQDTGTGTLNIQGSTQVLIGGINGEVGVQYVENAGVGLRHNNVTKLVTESTGVAVIGKITGLTAGTANTDAVNLQQLNDATTGALIFKGTWSAASTTTGVHAAGSTSTAIVLENPNLGISVGSTVTGTGIPAGTTVTAVLNTAAFSLSASITMTNGAVATFTTVGGIPDLSQTARKVTGDYYICETAGVATPNGASTTPNEWAIGDWVAFSDLTTDAWQKIDNSSVLSGAGTGGSVAGWSGSGTSVTLQDAPITFNASNNTIVTGKLGIGSLNASFNLYNDGTSYFNGAVTVDAALTQTGGAASTFSGNVGIGGSPSHTLDVKGSDTNNATIARFYSNTATRGSFIIKNGFNVSPTTFIGTAGGSEQLSIGTNSTEAIRIDGSQNATFAGNIISTGTNTFQKAQGTNQFDTGSFLRLHPTATTNSTGYTNMFFGTSTTNNYGVAIGGVKTGTGDDPPGGTAPNSPAFSIRILDDSIIGVEALRISNSLNATFAGDVSAVRANFGSASLANILTVSSLQGSMNTRFLSAGNGGYVEFASSNDGIYGYIGTGSHLLNPIVNNDDFVIRATKEFAVSIVATEKFRINASGNATFAGDVSVEDNLYLTDAGTTRAKIQLNSSDRDDLDIIAVSLGSNMKFFTVDAERMRINSAGEVGIGTTDPQANLHVKSGSNTVLRIEGNQNTRFATLQLKNADQSWMPRLEGTSQDFVIRDDTHASEPFRIKPSTNTGSNDSAIIIDGDANVGIGTTNPLRKLDLIVDATTDAVRIKNTNSNGGGLSVFAANGGGGANRILTLGDSVENVKVSVIENGNFGIGTTNPTRLLTVAKGDTATGFGDHTGPIIAISQTNTTVNNQASLLFQSGNAAVAEIAAKITNHGSAFGDLLFGTRSASGYTVKMEIASAGAIKFNNYGAGTLVSDASGNITATTSGATVYTPDIWELANPQTISNGTVIYRSEFNGKLTTGTTGTVAGGDDFRIKIVNAGVYEISYDATLQTTYSIRQVIAGYFELDDDIIMGSAMSNYLRVTGNNQGGVSSVANSFYFTATANQELRFAFQQIGPANFTGMQNITIKNAFSGMKSTVSVRRIS